MNPPAGWYPQTDGRRRYWDGETWTEFFAPDGGTATLVTTPAAGVKPAHSSSKTKLMIWIAVGALVLIGLGVMGYFLGKRPLVVGPWNNLEVQHVCVDDQVKYAADDAQATPVYPGHSFKDEMVNRFSTGGKFSETECDATIRFDGTATAVSGEYAGLATQVSLYLGSSDDVTMTMTAPGQQPLTTHLTGSIDVPSSVTANHPAAPPEDAPFTDAVGRGIDTALEAWFDGSMQ